MALEGKTYRHSQKIGLGLGPLLYILILELWKPEGLSSHGVAVLACTAWMATWWVTEAIAIAITACLPIILFPLTGALSLEATTTSFGHKYIFLYAGGFMLAIAIEKWKLHRRIALTIIKAIGTDVSKIILGFMVATAFMSMWISNTATAVMMMPIGLAIISQMQDHPDTPEDESSMFAKALLLSIAYAASIGGMATLIGTPPNLVFAGIVKSQFQVDISFGQWMLFALPISILLLTLCWIYLTRFAYHFKNKEFPGGISEVHRLYEALGKLGKEEGIVLLVFVMTAMLWIGKDLIKTVMPGIDDTIIAMAAAIILFIIPANGGKERLLEWNEAVKLPWGILLLFGGGMALASGFESSGLALWIGQHMTALSGLSVLLIIVLLVAAVNFLTEITSNLATTAMLLPVLIPMASPLGVHPYILLVAATLAASCAFMLPVATPPNAVVFGTGQLRIPDMVRAGIVMNLISIVLLALAVYYFLPVFWNL